MSAVTIYLILPLSRLTLMFDKSRTKGHVDLCMKRYDGRTKPTPKPRKNVKQKGKKIYVSNISNLFRTIINSAAI